MKTHKLVRSVSVLAASALILGAFVAGPADAKKKKPKPKPPVPAGCPAFTPIEPASGSGETAEVLEQPVLTITDAYTEDKPLEIEYSHGAAFWNTATQKPVQEDTVFFNLQVDSANPEAGLYVYQTWAKQPGSDMDLYLWDGVTGEQATNSGSSNLTPDPTPISLPVIGPLGLTDTGGWGLESISGFPVNDCAGFTAESRAFTTKGEAMVLKVWLGEPAV